MSCKKEKHSKGWKQIAETVKKAFGEKCALCGIRESRYKSNSKLTIHHIDCQRQNNTQDNLIALCKRCHHQIDQEASYYFSYKGKQLEMFPDAEDYLDRMENLRLAGLQRDLFENDTDTVSDSSPLINEASLSNYQLSLPAGELLLEAQSLPMGVTPTSDRIQAPLPSMTHNLPIQD